MSNRHVFVPMLVLLLSLPGLAAAQTLERYALITGSNQGGPGTSALKYAASDAKRVQEVLTSLGGLRAENSLMLVNPEKESLLQGLAFLKSKMTKGAKVGQQAQFVFYYSGHSDEKGLLLGGERLDYADLKARIDTLGADVQVVILDSCSSGAFTRSKGGQRTPPFLLDLSTVVEGHAFLTSSTAEEVSQESDRIQSSFFTHSLVEGLRGAADSNGDGRVSLNELYDYAYNQTMNDTLKTSAGSQHPAFDIQLSGKGNLVLTDLRNSGAKLTFSQGLSGRLSVRDISGHLVAEVSKLAERDLTLGVDEGYYRVSRLENGLVSEATVLVDEAREFFIVPGAFLASTTEVTRARGALELPWGFRFSGLGLRFVDGERPDAFAANLLVGVSPAVAGPMLAVLGNVALDDSFGYQGSLAANIAGTSFRGVQTSLAVNWVGGNFSGIQAAAVNGIGEAGRYVQAGLFNWGGKDFEGLQLAYGLNIAQKLAGVQIGFVNYADEMTGVQLGLINISRKLTGLPIGLIDIQFNGQNHIDQTFGFTGTSWDTLDRDVVATTVLRLGSEYFYKYLSLTTRAWYTGEQELLAPLGIGAGLGFRWPVAFRGFALQLDAGISFQPPSTLVLFEPSGDLSYAFVPIFRTFATWNLFGSVGLIAGWEHPVFTKNLHRDFSTTGKFELKTAMGNLFITNRPFLGLQL